MSIENPTTILVDGNGNPIGVTGNPLAVTGSVALTEPITGTVAVDNFPVVQTVTGSLALSQPITGAVTVNGTVDIGNFPATQAVTGSLALSQPAHVIIDSSTTLPVSGSLTVTVSKSSTAAASSVPAITFSQQLLAANSNRLGAIFFNDSPGTAYLLFGSGSQLTSWTYRLFPYAVVELNEPIFTGIISAIWNRATGSMRVTELN